MLRLTVLTLAILAAPLLADDDLTSGPKKGAKLPALKVYNCTGDDKEKTTDHVAARKDKVTLYYFINAEKFDRPMNQLLKKLDGKLADDFEGVTAVAVWLTDDEDKTKKFLPRVQMSVDYGQTTLAVHKGSEGPKGWDINSDAHLTVIVAAKGKVAERFAYKSINDTEVRKIVKELKAATKGDKKKD